MKSVTFVVLLIFSFPSVVCLGGEVKVICASRTGTPPVMDGTLDYLCWQKTDVLSDFTTVSTGQPLKRRTTMRVLYDENNIYFGFEVFWDDVERLKESIIATKEKYASTALGVWMKEGGYENTCGLEMFIDPGAGGRNYYQLLFNAAGQSIGNYKGMVENFNIEPEVRSALRGGCWSVELRYPAKGLIAGQEWGLNICRNDETYYGIWKQVSGAYANPKLFGRLVIGDYSEWWEEVGGAGAKAKLETLKGEVERYSKLDPNYPSLAADAESNLRLLEKLADKNPSVSRDHFIALYERYAECRDKMERLQAYGESLQLLAKPPSRREINR